MKLYTRLVAIASLPVIAAILGYVADGRWRT